ncbi:MAG: hypothetical protein JKX81_13900, partial [Arenicella sp.]|nr:hypothetical protein [Arenicella sp.]
DTKQFNKILNDYHVLPRKLAGVVSPMLPVVELAVALSLCLTVWFGWFNGVSAGASLFLLIAYTGALSKVYFEGKTLEDCGCGGSSNQPISLWPLLRNVVLIGGCVCLYFNQGRDINNAQAGDSIFYSVLAMLLAIALSLIYWTIEELQKNTSLISLLEKHYD